MTKRQICVTLDVEVAALAKEKIPNISGFINNLLACELKIREFEKDKESSEMKLLIAKLSTELEQVKKELEQAKIKLADKKEIKSKEWNPKRFIQVD